MEIIRHSRKFVDNVPTNQNFISLASNSRQFHDPRTKFVKRASALTRKSPHTSAEVEVRKSRLQRVSSDAEVGKSNFTLFYILVLGRLSDPPSPHSHFSLEADADGGAQK